MCNQFQGKPYLPQYYVFYYQIIWFFLRYSSIKLLTHENGLAPSKKPRKRKKVSQTLKFEDISVHVLIRILTTCVRALHIYLYYPAFFGPHSKLRLNVIEEISDNGNENH